MSIYSGIPQQTLLDRLAAAQTAYLDLVAGAQVVVVRMGDKHVQYTPADQDDLRRHIYELQSATGTATARCSGVYVAGGKGL